MISNQILQNTIEGLKAIARVDFCVMDTDGKEAASTMASMSGCGPEAAEFAKSPADSQEIQGDRKSTRLNSSHFVGHSVSRMPSWA